MTKKLNPPSLKSFMLGILFLLSSLFNYSGLGQELSKENKLKLEAIAQYSIAEQDNTGTYLERIQYTKPVFISQNEWDAMPAVRKIEMAYKAAEINGQGSQFISAFANEISHDYNSIKSERILSSHFSGFQKQVLKFSNPASLNDFKKIPVPKNIKSQLLTIGKYVNEAALGSLQNVFSTYMNLSETQIYDILTKSSNNKVAFEQGLLRSSVPPPHETKLANIAEDLQRNFEACRNDIELSKISKRKPVSTFSFIGDEINPIQSNLPGGHDAKKPGVNYSNKDLKTKFKSNYDKYSKYKFENYKTPRSRKFISMKRNIRGFGGVIFGDTIFFPAKPGLIELKWRPINDTVKDDFLKIGYLDLFFSDSSTKIYGPVLYEDVFAANAIVMDPANASDEGIGMVSIHDPIGSYFSDRRFTVTLNPALSNLRIGWSMACVDAFPSAKKSFEDIIQTSSEKKLFDNFYKEEASTWKITDRPFIIRYTNSKVILEDISLSMFRFSYKDTIIKGKYITKEDTQTSRNFNKLLPLICSKVKEYERVNNFAKVLALYRWAKKSSSSIVNVTSYNSFIKAPVNIVVTKNQTIDFYNIKEDKDIFEVQRSIFLNSFYLTDSTSTTRDSILWACNSISNNRRTVWEILSDEHPKLQGNTESYFSLERSANNWIEDKLFSYTFYQNKFSAYESDFDSLRLLCIQKTNKYNSMVKILNASETVSDRRVAALDKLELEIYALEREIMRVRSVSEEILKRIEKIYKENPLTSSLFRFHKFTLNEKQAIIDHISNLKE